MLIDAANPEETRVAVVNGTKLEEFDYETEFRKQLKGNIYLAKVTRVEPSLQAAFVEYGGNRHAFLPFPEIHADYYRIPVADRPHDEIHDEPGESLALDSAGEEEISEQAPESAISGNNAENFSLSEGAEEEGPQDGFPEESGASYGEEALPEQGEAALSESGEIAAAESALPSPVETLGGDEVEEMRPRRRPPLQRYKIQEVVKRRQIMLIQVSKEERGNKGAAVTTFLSLPGRYCVLMPNSPRGGGVSRKIANQHDRKRMKELMSDLDLPDGMSVILRTAGLERSKSEIKRDLDYLLRLWEQIRDLTLQSTAPALVYEEGNLIKRSIRDGYTRDIDEVYVSGDAAFRQAKDFMRMLMPSHAKKVQPYRDQVPLFFRFQIESQIDAIHNPQVTLRSGGYIVIDQTEALVSIDVNSGRSTRERNIEETAYKTNLEAADEIARQVRLRDMGGLIVIDFIDMEDPRHDAAVERRLKEAMKNDRARIQIGRMSAFGLLELSRQRLHPSLIETNFHTCPHCRGMGIVRSIESSSFVILRAIEEEGIKGKSAEVSVFVPESVALFILNQKRALLSTLENRYGFKVTIAAEDGMIGQDYRIERTKAHPPGFVSPVVMQPLTPVYEEGDLDFVEDEENSTSGDESEGGDENGSSENGEREKRGRRRGRRRRSGAPFPREDGEQPQPAIGGEAAPAIDVTGEQPDFYYPNVVTQTEAEGQFQRSGGTGPNGPRGGRSRRGRGRGRGNRGPGGNRFEGENQQGASEEGGNNNAAMDATPFSETAPSITQPDYTPRAHSTEPEAPASDSVPPAPSPPRDYESVNQTPEAPKQGWWKRLVQ
jgi:ribonuclease E